MPSIEYWVDQTSGLDTNNGSSSAPFKTVSKACSLIPAVVDSDVLIKIKAGNYSSESITLTNQINRSKTVIIEGVSFSLFTPPSGTPTANFIAVNGKYAKRTGANWGINSLAGKFAKVFNTYTGIVGNTSDEVEFEREVYEFLMQKFDFYSSTVTPPNFNISNVTGEGIITIKNMIGVYKANYGEKNTIATNLGVSGYSLIAKKDFGEIGVKKLVAGTNVSLNSSDQTITINSTGSGGSSGITGARNIGTNGEGVYSSTVGSSLQFKKILGAGTIAVTSDSTNVTITGTETTAANLGAGIGVFKKKVGTELKFRSLEEGTNISLSLDGDGDKIVISNTGAGEANTASNLGDGAGVFKSKSGIDLQFKSLKASGATSISSDDNTITISSTDTGEVNTASNLGLTGEGVFAQKSGVDLQFKKLKSGSNISLSSDTDSITITATTSGETNTASNTGTGTGVYKEKVGVDLKFKSLKASGATSISSDDDSITISSTDTGEINTASNTGTGTGIFAQKSGADLQFKSIKTSGSVSISSDADSVTISGVDTGETNTASNLGTGAGVYAQKSGVDLQFKSLKASGLISVNADSTSITYSTTAEINTASNTGTGTGVYAQKVGSDLQFKTLKSSGITSISADADSITISSTAPIQSFYKNFSFSDTFPISIGIIPASRTVKETLIESLTAFNSGVNFTVGDSGNISRYASSLDMNMQRSDSKFIIDSGFTTISNTEVFLYLQSGSPSVGTGKITIVLI